MSRVGLRHTGFAALIALCVLVPASLVLAYSHGPARFVLLLGITEGPDPIEASTSRPGEAPDVIANPGGTARGDGRISVAFAPAGHHAVAVWAYGTGSDFDIAMREWDGYRWKDILFLSHELTADLDPRAFIEADGTVWVTWWSEIETPGEGSGKIQFTRRAPGSEIWDATHSIEPVGSKPSLVVYRGRRLLSFERQVADRRQVVLHTTISTSQPYTDVLVESAWSGSPEPVLHTAGDRVWIDWQHSDTLYGYSEYVDGGWDVPNPDLPWSVRFWDEQLGRSIQEGAVGR